MEKPPEKVFLSNFVSYGNYESNYRAICQFLKVWEVSTGVRQMLQNIPDGQNGVLLGLNPRVKA
jgi:hypothetical protein